MKLAVGRPLGGSMHLLWEGLPKSLERALVKHSKLWAGTKVPYPSDQPAKAIVGGRARQLKRRLPCRALNRAAGSRHDLWMELECHCGDNPDNPGIPDMAESDWAIVIEHIANRIEQRHQARLDLDCMETVDWLRYESDQARQSR
jgi:hypothetical protein